MGRHRPLLALLALTLCCVVQRTDQVILTPPYFNLAEGKKIYASATCGEGIEGPELYCKLVGANAENEARGQLIQGQVCDYCDPSRPEQMHPPEFAVDGMETWWQSPPLSRGMKYNEINLTIDLGQEFHVAYIYIRMGNSPRPGLWVLEKSSDYGNTYTPWQYFSDSPADCETYFGRESLQPITRDDSVVCSTEYSKIVPLEGGEIPISLLNNRPSANMYFNSSVLQEWTRATNVRFRLLRTKNLLGHLMSLVRQDPTVTRRYFYSIKDISIGGRCMCNGHADTCDIQDPENPSKLLCRCQHNTCGPQCATCCPGFEQKAWRISKSYKKFECEPCNCFNHTTECEYDPEVDEQRLSLDIHGNYEGGGVCQNCQHNTEGINCNKCKPQFFRPFKKEWNEIDVCQPCDCNFFYSTGNCAEGTGKCECRPEFTSPDCSNCSFGYFGYPNCRPCECNLNGTDGYYCEAKGGKCPCKNNYGGLYCKQCAERFYKFPDCLACECNPTGSLSDKCNMETGNCSCKSNYRGRTCDICEHGYYNYPSCIYCQCDVHGTVPGICDKSTGKCLCKPGYGGERCDQCLPGYYGYPDCKPCNCSDVGSASTVCEHNGKCPCLPNFAGRTCDQCSPGYYKYPDCLPCNCDSHGSIGVSCDNEGRCQCQHNFETNQCSQCKEGFYNFPLCEECNCNPAGVVSSFAGCGSVPAGELCQCKPRVTGRICDTCRPLFWNLNLTNPEGCESCDCNPAGVLAGLAVCEGVSGQCVCKPGVEDRSCSRCKDGGFDLREDDVFGCKDCDCDIGGSVSSICDKLTGQCPCQSRINGRTCREPLQTHYFPTLYQFQYEVEDGHTPTYTHVRYGYKEDVFPNYSWKGYAIFTPQLQNEIIQDVYIQKPSLYRMVLSYINPNMETVNGVIKITPDNPSDIEQNFEVLFKPTRVPMFVTVSGEKGLIPSPLVMNPGRWAVSIKVKNNLFLDYFVLLPAAFYEATILGKKVETPCSVDYNGLCRQYSYPNLATFDSVLGEGGFVMVDETRDNPTEYFHSGPQLTALKEDKIPMLNSNQQNIHMDLTITKPGPHVLVINYLTPEEDLRSHTVNVQVSSQNNKMHGIATLPPCAYTMLCRNVIVESQKRINVFNFDTNYISIVIKGEADANLGIKSVVAIPYDQWSLDYIRPKPVCVRKDGKCVKSEYPIAPDSKKVKFELGNEDQISKIRPPHIFDNTTNLIYLDHNDAMIDVRNKVPNPGFYVFIVHYYQPNYPEFDMDVLIQNGQFYEAKLPIKHCPSNSGCRATVIQEDGNFRFSLTENFVLSFKEPNHKSVWLEHLIVIPNNSYTPNLLIEESFDQTGEFISTCGNNHFYINESTEGFCREAVFSLTTDYNNGALPCQCDYDGSLSFECEKFGGQCTCKPNVIGRKCEVCKNGYFGFPNCKLCDCPPTAFCEPNTGQCICPPRVTGERCDQCMPLTFGYDQLIGCEECNCNPLGVLNNLQCDLFNGSCSCKPHVVGRMCDDCEAGHYNFPYCEQCDCDYRGTTLDICDKRTAECHCKINVEGPLCEHCKEGTYNLQKNNEEGCTKCFCFGKTTRCISSNWWIAEIAGMSNWTLFLIQEGTNMTLTPVTDITVEQLNVSVIGVDLTDLTTEDKVVYFSAPWQYLQNKLTSYGGRLNYTIFYTTLDSGSAVSGADVILYGAGMFLFHDALEQPAAKLEYMASLEIVESNFVLENGLQANREHLMTVLEDLQGLYIRAKYWETSVTTRLGEVTLDRAIPDYYPGLLPASSVEMCQCPPNYWGLSCEECAPGYYRVSSGPHGGYCVPCQCNGHADECDVNTGICIDCKHNTGGDHCELCEVGYHGNALQGTPMDCLICACPLPIASNNFATGCDVSPDGEKISCDCMPGYYGARCQSCAAGFYGRPETPGDYCKPCDCSGNINPDEPGSCDSVSGECLNCLNNTFGAACALCAPGFYGDAVILKDCQSCICDELGTDRCDSYSGTCQCHPNVIGEKCDSCKIEHYGFSSGEGCKPCECQIASESAQCDDATGQCRCKRGVTGRSCDKCAPGFWNYGSEGCSSCGCNTDYSLGFGCNAKTGQCECLPGVIGEKCDHCPYRWVLIENQGCFECDSCSHNLLDVTDELKNMTDPVIAEFESIASSYFTSRRLGYINNTVQELTPAVNQLDPNQINILHPITSELELIEQDSKNLNRKSNYSLENSEKVIPQADNLYSDAIEILESIRKTALNANQTVQEVDNLSFDNGEGPKIEQALNEGNSILSEIRDFNFTEDEIEAENQFLKSFDLLNDMKDFNIPVIIQLGYLDNLKSEIKLIQNKLNDITNYTQYTVNKITEAEDLNTNYRGDIVTGKISTIKGHSDVSVEDLKEAHEYLTNATKWLAEAHRARNKLKDDVEGLDRLNELINQTISEDFAEIDPLEDAVRQASDHSTELSDEAQRFDHQLADTRNISGNALDAAKAYENIVNATKAAKNASKEALKAAEETNELLDGLEEKSLEAEQMSATMLEEAKVLYEATEKFGPLLDESNIGITDTSKIIKDNEDNLNKINDSLGRLNEKGHEEQSENSIFISDLGKKQSKEALDRISLIADNTKQDLDHARLLPKKMDDTTRDLHQAHTQLDKINTILPNITSLIDELGPEQTALQDNIEDIEKKIKALEKKIEEARKTANRVKVGLTFYPNTTLELKNPPNLADQATKSHISTYLKTESPNGLVFYLGNSDGTKLKRTRTDDYMALEIENGYPVLNMDIGNGPQRIISSKYVADNNWYQVLIDRTGPVVKLTVRQEEEGGRIIEHVEEQVTDGPNTIFNLDKDKSKIFVGGYPPSFEMQNQVKSSSFQGQMEEFMIGDTPISFWNFVDGEENNRGVEQRDKLLILQPSTGYRFNGKGYAILDARSHPLQTQTEVRLRFKTSTPEGLMFLVGKGETFMSLEIVDGKVLFQFNLGQGTGTISTSSEYNDGEWHEIKAARDRNAGLLYIDGVKVGDGAAPGGKSISVTENMFFGGYPKTHNFLGVTNRDFDGCIDDVAILETPVDLSENKGAVGVAPGCQDKYFSLVSFDKPGYIRHPNATSANAFRASLKFKTDAKDGIIFYATDREQSAGISLAMVNGGLMLISQKQELITSPLSKYNDSEWHVVTVTHNDEELRLDIDDWEEYVTDSPPARLHIMYGQMFIGGVPSNYTVVKGALKTTKGFRGCIGDATLNGMIINFANATDKQAPLLGTCILEKLPEEQEIDLQELEQRPIWRPQPAPVEPKPITEPPEEKTELPTRGDGGRDSPFHPEEEEEIDKEDDKDQSEELEITTQDVVMTTTEVTTLPTTKQTEAPVKETKATLPPTVDRCALPGIPDEEVPHSAGFRFGTVAESRLEFNTSRGRYKNKYDFVLEFKTTASNGTMFYVKDQTHSHFVALIIIGGKVRYIFNCGTGPGILESDQEFNDGLWHKVEFSRSHNEGKLVIDGRTVAEGKSDGPSKVIQIIPPYYIGGVPENFTHDVNANIKTSSPFIGCIRGIHMNGKPMENPVNHNVIPCSENVESGVFFKADGTGYVKIYDRFKVGLEIDIQMDIKPRNTSGLLMSVHGKRDYLVLQMVDGVIKFTVDNGKGPIEAAFKPPSKHYFCDGNWHSIQAIKSKNVVSLSVDKTFADAGIGQSHSTDTKGALFLGGHQKTGRLRGFSTRAHFKGCIKNVNINNEAINISHKMAAGGVLVGVCPTV